jgi:septation ring formation regulator
MSSGITVAIISVLILIVLLIGIVVGLNRRNIHLIGDLDKKADSLADIAAADSISRLEKMELAGESLDTFTKWRDTYQKLAGPEHEQLKKELTQAAELNDKYKLFQANKLIKKVTSQVETDQESLHDSKAVFKQLLDSNRDNRIQYESLLKNYQATRKDILANSFEYGVALNAIEDILTGLENDFQNVKNLTNQGDHVEAKRVLTRIASKQAELNKQLEQVKTGWKQLQETFPAQLEELSSVYKKMVADKYCIKQVDVLAEIRKLYSAVDKSQEDLKKLATEDFGKENKEIADQIDRLYNILTLEYKARPFVTKNQDRLVRVLSDMTHSSQQLIDKLHHIDESYELTHGELKEALDLSQRVAEFNDEYTKDVQDLAEGEGVYSEIKDRWLLMTQELAQIADRQKKISQDVDGLFDAEKIARSSVDSFKQDISLLYRRVQRKQLPGKPESFVQMYTLVVNEVGKIAEELDQVRINMEEISQELIQIQQDVNRLHKEADSIISSADLVQLALQYSNRYLNYGEIKKARAKAVKLYQEDYNYSEALDVIATALEHIEPGSYNRIESNYYAEQDKSLN